jgi:hypothetical protein
MGSVLLLLFSCAVPGDDSFSGGGTPGEPTGGGGSVGGSDGGSDGGDDGAGTDDTGKPVGCTADDLEWSSLAQNNRASKPFYSGDTITFWGYVDNPCGNTVSLTLESTCLFDIVSLQPPNGAPTQQATVNGCTTTSQVVDLESSDLLTKAHTWGPLYVMGTYSYGLRVTTPDALVLTGSFTIQ